MTDASTTDDRSTDRYDHTHEVETMTLDGGVVSVETAHARARFVVHHDGTIEAGPWATERTGEAWVNAAIEYLHRADIQTELYGPDAFGGQAGGLA